MGSSTGRWKVAREDNQQIARTFVQLTKRAETADPATLVQTFVDIGTLLPSISTRDNQVVFGRRGTGKTHALVYILETAKANGVMTVYVDLRTAGSSGSIYSDGKIPLSERATRLLLDVLGFVHGELVSAALASESLDLSIIGPRLDAFAESITEVRVEGAVSVERQRSRTSSFEDTAGSRLLLSARPSLDITDSTKDSGSDSEGQKVVESGTLTHRVHFGSLSRALDSILDVLPKRQLIIALDEWVAIPFELQPFLA
jgi:Cdc6-like AAA superfamily ATPase